MPTFPDKVAFECIENELGVPLESIYSSISASPIAAASLGQVYKAVLRTTGEDVAVKVQRPGIEEAVGLDFYLVRGLTLLVDRYVDIITSNVTDLLDEFARRVYQELNYVQVYYCCLLNLLFLTLMRAHLLLYLYPKPFCIHPVFTLLMLMQMRVHSLMGCGIHICICRFYLFISLCLAKMRGKELINQSTLDYLVYINHNPSYFAHRWKYEGK